jgi:hypothetical protein
MQRQLAPAAACFATSQLFLVSACVAAVRARGDVALGCILCWLTSSLYHGWKSRRGGVLRLAADILTVNTVAASFTLRCCRAVHPACAGLLAWGFTAVGAFAAAFWVPWLQCVVHVASNGGILWYVCFC